MKDIKTSEVEAAKNLLEYDINSALNRFNTSTGTMPSSVNININDMRRISSIQAEYVLVGIDISVNI